MKIANDKVVSIHYTLRNDGGEVLDSSQNAEPLVYLHGKGNIIPGLETALLEKASGDKLNVTIIPEEAYGTRDENLVQDVPIDKFQEPDQIKVGSQVQIQTNQGVRVAVIAKMDAETVTLDMNHPLADQTLHFDVEVMEIRDASAEELSHGHVHGPGGHQH